jgi:hypothetical protein
VDGGGSTWSDTGGQPDAGVWGGEAQYRTYLPPVLKE